MTSPESSGPRLNGVNALAEVLIGRDRAPMWRSDRARRAAVLAGWLGWLALAVSGVVAVTLARNGSRAGQAGWPHGSAAIGWLAVTLAVAGARYGPRFLWWMFALSLLPVWLWWRTTCR
jgi:hypothetical protein